MSARGGTYADEMSYLLWRAQTSEQQRVGLS